MANLINGLVAPKATDRWETYNPSKTYSKVDKYIIVRSSDENGKEELFMHFVSDEEYQKYYSPIWKKRKQLQRSGECQCKQKDLWKCDGECLLCLYFKSRNKSLDAEFDNGNGDMVTIADTLVDEVNGDVDYEESKKRVDEFMRILTETQRRRLKYKLDNPSISNREIANIEHVDHKSIDESFISIQKKYKEFFK